MDSIREMLARLRSFLHARQRDADFDEELAAHIELATEENIERGMSPQEARRRALISLGGVEQAKEEHRDSRGFPGLDAFLSDVRYAGRTLRRDAALATFAILIVGLGVGATTSVFSVVNALLLRAFPFENPDRLVWIANGNSANLSAQTVQVSNLLELREQGRSFAAVAGFSPFHGDGDIRLTGSGEPERLTGVPVAEGFFEMLGLRSQLGRFFTPEECRWGGPKAVVLSHGFWRRRFGESPGIVGTSIQLDGAPATVVGVLPASFDFAATFTPGSRADLFTPLSLGPEINRKGNMLALIGRLEPGVNLDTAQAEASVIGDRIQEGPTDGGGWRNSFHPTLTALRERVSGRFRYALTVLAGAVGFLMLLVCANLSNLLLARASARQKEMAIRTALGAPRARLIRQMLVESVVLSCCGAAFGLILAFVGTGLLARIHDTSIPLVQGIRVDGAALAFTVSLALLTGVLFGLVPALQASASSPNRALEANGRGASGGPDRNWMRSSLVIAEVALACVLLTGAGLLTRSLVRVLDVELGFRAEHVLALRVDPGRAYATPTQKLGYFDGLLRAVRSVPGVDALGLTDALPLGDNFGWRTWSLKAEGQDYERGHAPSALVRIVDTGYLDAMKVPLTAGRGFTDADNESSERVMLINHTLARTLWPGEDPLGKTIRSSGVDRRVIGVVRGVRYFGPEAESGSEMYLALRQTGDFSSIDLVVRGAGSSTELAPRVRAALKGFDPNLPALRFRTLEGLVDQSVFPRRFVVFLLTGFAVFGLILASLGIFGVISYSVSQRRQELGVRMALGASAADLQMRVLLQTLRLAIVGLVVGIPASWMTSRAIRGLLFGVGSTDPLTFAGVVTLLAAVAAFAGYVPARSASRLNPVEALRCQ